MSSGVPSFRPNRSIGRRYLTQAEASAYDDGFAAFRDGVMLPPREPPLTPAQAAYRTGWFDAEKRELDK